MGIGFPILQSFAETIDVNLVYQPDNENNSAKQLSSYPFSLGPNETRVFPNVREIVSEDEGRTSTVRYSSSQ